MLQTRHLLQALEAAGADHNVVYVSVPITSGEREISLMNALGVRNADELRATHRDRWLSDVVRPNEEAAHACATLVRAAPWTVGTVVVDPSRMTVEGWSQDDYNAFWVELMRRHVRKLVASPGWAYSRGARIEVELALSLGIEIVDINGTLLKREAVELEASAARSALLDDGWRSEEVDAYLPPLSDTSSADLRPSAQSDIFAWLIAERQHQVSAFGPDVDDSRTTNDGLKDGGWWQSQLNKYWTCAKERGLDDPNGRLALAKYVATACGLLESSVRIHGPISDSARIDRDDA